ncbi:putative signal transducing protein [Aquimarina rubra]|uniref:Signal transducing protein n=1 Tax=Aquimarina rubra TaxID=1920033 RepID=A0ABW5LMM9_9FLAO
MNKYIKIYTGTSILANRLAFLLDEIHIPSMIKDHRESGRLAGFGTIEDSTELFILDNDVKKADEIIKNFKKETLK